MREAKGSLSRRGFISDMRTVGAVAAAASLVSSVHENIHVPEAKAPPEYGGGYQLTEHVKQYYQTTRT